MGQSRKLRLVTEEQPGEPTALEAMSTLIPRVIDEVFDGDFREFGQKLQEQFIKERRRLVDVSPTWKVDQELITDAVYGWMIQLLEEVEKSDYCDELYMQVADTAGYQPKYGHLTVAK